MRILLAQNSLYYPSHGGGEKSNRLLMEALAARGHACRVVSRIPHLLHNTAPAANIFERLSVEAHVVTSGNPRQYLASEIESFRPDVILASTDDPAQSLLEIALRAENARVVYMVRATLAVPFGPDCAFPSAAKTARLAAVDRVVGVSQYVADYVRRWSGIDAVHVPISLMEPVKDARTGSTREFVLMVNPCAVKGIDIFVALADAFPETEFAAVPTWGTNEQDRGELAKHPNIQILDPVDDIDLLLRRTRVLLVPSVWAEARSRIVVEAMLRGIPVMASNVGGIPEAKLGVPYLLPVNPIAKYHTRVDEQMVPVAEVPPQDIGPWREALERLLTDAAHYEEIANASRKAALEYVNGLTIEPFERLLFGGAGDRFSSPAGGPQTTVRPAGLEKLSPEKRRLLAVRLRNRAPSSAWFPGADSVSGQRLFWFPHAGGGTGHVGGVPNVCPVLLPGRESRIAEAPFERMAPLVEALAAAIDKYLAQPFAFFGHSMGAVVAFELARALRRRDKPLPEILIVSSARAPQYRRNHVPQPPPSDDELIDELRQLGGIPPESLDDPAMLRVILPALRADTALYRQYVYTEEAPLPCPIRAYGGEGDPHIGREQLEAWRAQTEARFAVHLFPGGHFYLRKARNEFLDQLACDLVQRVTGA